MLKRSDTARSLVRPIRIVRKIRNVYAMEIADSAALKTVSMLRIVDSIITLTVSGVQNISLRGLV